MHMRGARDWNSIPENVGDPDFSNILALLRREEPARPTLFEFFLNGRLHQRLTPGLSPEGREDVAEGIVKIHAFRNAGYDYATLKVDSFWFHSGEAERRETRSLNDGALIKDRKSFDEYEWPNPDENNYEILAGLKDELLPGMKLIVHAPGGVLENFIRIVGYENMCFMRMDDEQLMFDIFENIGKRLLRYYERCLEHDSVGAVIGNDDWGFKSQTMLAPEDMRKFVFPWHRKIVEAAHSSGRPAILHSCGNLSSVMDDVIDEMAYDGKHSYEDGIQPVEEAYEQYHDRIAIMGGIDVDFVCRADPGQVYERSLSMLERTRGRGGFGLGTGNSVPEYVPDEGYFAMIGAALDMRRR